MKLVGTPELTIDTSLNVVGLIFVLLQVWYLLPSLFSAFITQQVLLCTARLETLGVHSALQWLPASYLAMLSSSPQTMTSLPLGMLYSSLSETLFSVVIVLLGILYLSGLPTRWASYNGFLPLQSVLGPDTPPPRIGFAI
jgi:hypothetical protein